ncbi:hypothetical protein C8R43DRAFT_964006 [Mycena crocata]|nr:hypothetical protein C8R43DRAFT_964006 [Mycena crocata]
MYPDSDLGRELVVYTSPIPSISAYLNYQIDPVMKRLLRQNSFRFTRLVAVDGYFRARNRHRPTAYDGLQKGERFSEMDYFITGSDYLSIAPLVISYDISCQFDHNVFHGGDGERVKSQWAMDKTDGEQVERAWAAANPIAPRGREMGAGQRREMLDEYEPLLAKL